ncbi:MAG: hydrogenase [Clostridiales bacterium]|nr:hydrogenase [Clostridiales bacterium]
MKTAPEKGQGKFQVTRRQFFGVAAVAGSMAALSGCKTVDKIGGDSGWLPTQYRNSANWPVTVKGRVPIDPKNPCIVRRDDACILCGQCADVCQNIQTIHGFYELPVKDTFVCIKCGQCSLWCPTGSIQANSHIEKVMEAINDPDVLVVANTAPATRVSLGEEFGMAPGTWVEGQQIAALRELGFDVVLDTNFTADLTIMEEATELVNRLTTGGTMPMMTSCCPGWVNFVEMYYPELMPNLSTAKSPMSMMGALVKTYYAKKKKVAPSKIFNVAIMPCLSKKAEAARSELNAAGVAAGDETMRDTDAVLSIRELAYMIKAAGIDFASLPEDKYDSLMGEGSGAGIIFGNTGGVMEAAIRTGYYLVTGQNPPANLLKLTPVRGLEGIKEATVEIPGFGPLRVAVGSSLKSARQLCEEIKAGKASFDFMEIMACPGGCIAGGGQPRTLVPPADSLREARIETLYKADAKLSREKRLSHENTEMKTLYKEFLGEAGGHTAHELLHTHYVDRGDSFVASNGGEW